MAASDDVITQLAVGVKNIGLVAQAINNKFPNWQTAPTTATSAGVAGQVAYDAGFLYVCVSSNVWKRTALSTF
jgi:hypothetical protein